MTAVHLQCNTVLVSEISSTMIYGAFFQYLPPPPQTVLVLDFHIPCLVFFKKQDPKLNN